MAKLDFNSLLGQVLEARLSIRRINSVRKSDASYRISFYTVKDAAGIADERPCLKDLKQVEYALSINQLAALRIASDKLTAVWADEFRDDKNGDILQSLIRELPSGKTLENARFKVAYELKVKNHLVSGTTPTPVYEDACYEGALEYTRGVRALLKDKTAEFFKSYDYNRGMAELRETLHLTKVKEGKNIDANLVLLPVFELTWV